MPGDPTYLTPRSRCSATRALSTQRLVFGSIDADPDRHDYALGEISNLAASITVKLSIMRHAGDGKRDMKGLRDLLQDYVDRVMAFAHGTER